MLAECLSAAPKQRGQEESPQSEAGPRQKYDKKALGRAIRAARIAAGHDQEDLAAIINHNRGNCNKNRVSIWEKGREHPGPNYLPQLEDYVRSNHPKDGVRALHEALVEQLR